MARGRALVPIILLLLVRSWLLAVELVFTISQAKAFLGSCCVGFYICKSERIILSQILVKNSSGVFRPPRDRSSDYTVFVDRTLRGFESEKNILQRGP
jgi:hypothetical protein